MTNTTSEDRNHPNVHDGNQGLNPRS